MSISVNGSPTQVPVGATVLELLAVLEMPGKGVAVEVNRELIPRAQHNSHRLCENDELEIVSLAGGG